MPSSCSNGLRGGCFRRSVTVAVVMLLLYPFASSAFDADYEQIEQGLAPLKEQPCPVFSARNEGSS